VRRLPSGGAVGRLALRLTLASKLSTLLVIVLIAGPLALATASLSVSSSLNRTDAEAVQAELGSASLRARGDVPDADIPPGSAVARLTRSSVDLGTGGALPLVSASGDLALAHSRLLLLAGRWPTGKTEIALTQAASANLGAAVGTRVPALENSLVVGVYRTFRDRRAVEAFTARGLASSRTVETLLLPPSAVDPGDAAAALRSSGSSVDTAADVSAWSNTVDPELAVAQWTVILFQLVLLVGAVFAVLRVRDRPTAVLLDELGATRAHTARLALVRGGGLTLVAAVIGLIGGAVIGEIGRRVIGESQSYVSETLRLPLGSLVVLVVLTVAMGMVAAAVFLRPTAGTAGSAPSGRVSLQGGVLAMVGLVTARLATVGDGSAATIALIVGCVAVALGASIAGAGLLAYVAQRARGPASVRISLRDVGRRSGHLRALVVAAVTGLVGVTMAVVALSSLAAKDRVSYRPVIDFDQALVADVSPERATALTAALSPERSLQLGAARGPSGELVRTERADGTRGFVAVVDTADLALFTNGAPVDDGRALLLNAEVSAVDQVTLHGRQWSADVSVTPIPSLRRTENRLPDIAISKNYASQVGLREDPNSQRWLYDMGRPLTDADFQKINTLIPPRDAASVVIERGYADQNAGLRGALGAGLVVFGVLTTVAVVVLGENQRAELRALLYDLGAPRRLARSLPVWSAAYLSFSFVVIATGIAVPLVAIALEETALTVDWRGLAVGSMWIVLTAVGAAALIGRRTGGWATR
jgi:hypothetical protein